MRLQPDIPTTLLAAAQRLDEEASQSNNATLRQRTLGPIAMLLRRTAADFDTYVGDRLAEIDRLVEIVRDAIPIVDPASRPALETALPDDSIVDSRSPASTLDAAADRLHRALIAVTAELETVTGKAEVELLDRIWHEQTSVGDTIR